MLAPRLIAEPGGRLGRIPRVSLRILEPRRERRIVRRDGQLAGIHELELVLAAGVQANGACARAGRLGGRGLGGAAACARDQRKGDNEESKGNPERPHGLAKLPHTRGSLNLQKQTRHSEACSEQRPVSTSAMTESIALKTASRPAPSGQSRTPARLASSISIWRSTSGAPSTGRPFPRGAA